MSARSRLGVLLLAAGTVMPAPAAAAPTFAEVGTLRSSLGSATPPAYVSEDDSLALLGDFSWGGANVFPRPTSGWASATVADGHCIVNDISEYNVAGLTADGGALAFPRSTGIVMVLAPRLWKAAGLVDNGSWQYCPGYRFALTLPAGWYVNSDWRSPSALDDVRVFGQTIAAIIHANASQDSRIAVYERAGASWPTLDAQASVFLSAPAHGPGGASGFTRVAARGSTIAAVAWTQADSMAAPVYSIEVFERPMGGWASTATPVVTLASPGDHDLANGGTLATSSFLATADGVVAVGLATPGGTTDPVPTSVAVYQRPAAGWHDGNGPTAVLDGSGNAAGLLGPAAAFTPDGGTLLVTGYVQAPPPTAPFALGSLPGHSTALFQFDRSGATWATGTETHRLPGANGFGATLASNPWNAQPSVSVGSDVAVVAVGDGAAHVFKRATPIVVHGALTGPTSPVVTRTSTTFATTCTVDRGTASRCVVVGRTTGGVVVATGSTTLVHAAAHVAVTMHVKPTAGALLKKAGGILPLTLTATITPVGAAAVTATAAATLVTPTVKITLRSDVLFASGSATLTPGARSIIAALGVQIRGSRSARCDGHTDSQGSVAYNLDLGRRRAVAVCALLRKYVRSVTTRTFGESKPVASNGTAAGRQRNRRVEITITN